MSPRGQRLKEEGQRPPIGEEGEVTLGRALDAGDIGGAVLVAGGIACVAIGYLGVPAGLLAVVDRVLWAGGAYLVAVAVLAMVLDKSGNRRIRTSVEFTGGIGCIGVVAGLTGAGSLLLNLATWVLYVGGIAGFLGGIVYLVSQNYVGEDGCGRPR